MRKLPLLSVCGLVFNVAVLAALYVPGTSYAHAVFWLPFVPAFLTFGSALFVINGGRLGQLGWDQLWDALVALPRWVRAGLGLLFVATVAYMLTSQVGTQTELGFERTFAVVAVWLTAVGTALHYGVQHGREPGAGRRSYWIALAIFVVVGAALAAATFLLGSDPINDEKATHDRLAAQFGDASWYPNLIAANTYHGAFIVYLDTRDATVQANACTDLKPVAAGLGRVPDLYYATGGHGRFARTC
ncbi:hypothetical protein AB0K00_55565 [Dactylosporangium sp. NPDC049525]|uniref:hypothetical protein n=1 Tax=Dactylosporangium sp. NPDC049525 TaxID=3154730 RepID=UPI003440412C